MRHSSNTWNGSVSGFVQTSTVNKDKVHVLQGVACISASDCNAVGFEAGRDDFDAVGFVDHWNGKTWATSQTLSPTQGIDEVSLASVACVAGRCTAVGGAGSYNGGSITYVVASSTTASTPGAPTLTGYRAGNGWVSVAWDPPASSGDSPITSYVVTTSPGGQSVTVPADARRAVVTVPNGKTQTAYVQAVNDAGPGGPSNSSAVFTPASSTIKVTTQYNAVDNARLLLKNATYFGQSVADAQRTSVGILAYLVGLVHPPAMTPIAPPVSTGPNSYTTSWSAADQSALVPVMGQYGVTPSEAQYFSVQLVGYLLALGGH